MLCNLWVDGSAHGIPYLSRRHWHGNFEYERFISALYPLPINLQSRAKYDVYREGGKLLVRRALEGLRGYQKSRIIFLYRW